MIIDFHTHIFPENVRNAREHYFDGEPAFRLLYDSPGSKLVSAEETIAAMDEQGIDKAGYKLVYNVERGGGQDVFHLHLHLLGGWK